VPRQLSDYDKAYNVLNDLLNERDEKLHELLGERNALWDACEALHSTGSHGEGGKYRVTLVGELEL
jgi:hypothetical protein